MAVRRAADRGVSFRLVLLTSLCVRGWVGLSWRVTPSFSFPGLEVPNEKEWPARGVDLPARLQHRYTSCISLLSPLPLHVASCLMARWRLIALRACMLLRQPSGDSQPLIGPVTRW